MPNERASLSFILSELNPNHPELSETDTSALRSLVHRFLLDRGLLQTAQSLREESSVDNNLASDTSLPVIWNHFCNSAMSTYLQLMQAKAEMEVPQAPSQMVDENFPPVYSETPPSLPAHENISLYPTGVGTNSNYGGGSGPIAESNASHGNAFFGSTPDMATMDASLRNTLENNNGVSEPHISLSNQHAAPNQAELAMTSSAMQVNAASFQEMSSCALPSHPLNNPHTRPSGLEDDATGGHVACHMGRTSTGSAGMHMDPSGASGVPTSATPNQACTYSTQGNLVTTMSPAVASGAAPVTPASPAYEGTAVHAMESVQSQLAQAHAELHYAESQLIQAHHEATNRVAEHQQNFAMAQARATKVGLISAAVEAQYQADLAAAAASIAVAAANNAVSGDGAEQPSPSPTPHKHAYSAGTHLSAESSYAGHSASIPGSALVSLDSPMLVQGEAPSLPGEHTNPAAPSPMSVSIPMSMSMPSPASSLVASVLSPSAGILDSGMSHSMCSHDARSFPPHHPPPPHPAAAAAADGGSAGVGGSGGGSGGAAATPPMGSEPTANSHSNSGGGGGGGAAAAAAAAVAAAAASPPAATTTGPDFSQPASELVQVDHMQNALYYPENT